MCGNKNTLYLFECKCGNHYCIKHRLPEVHFCDNLEKFRKDAYDINAKRIGTKLEEKKILYI